MSDNTVQSSQAQHASDQRQPDDAAARDLISSVGLDQTLFVEAGAGTGKTTQLVRRIVSLVLEQGLGLADIAAITFTEAAATELQARVRVAFETLAADKETSDKTRVLCQQAIADADLAAISTVHGFASRILTEFSTAAGLPPRVTVLDEIASQLAHEHRWERFIDQLHADPDRHELLIRLSLLNIALSPQYLGQASFKNVAASFNQNWDRLTSIASGELPPLGVLDFSVFDQAVEQLATMCEFCLDPEDKLIRRIEDERLPSMRTVVNVSDPHRKLRTLASLPDRVWGPGSGGINKNWSIDVKDVKESLKAVTAAAETVVSNSAAELIDQMTALTATEVLRGALSRQESGGLEFHDLLVLARRVLRSNAEVRRVLHERYQAVLLDEFQDTDPIQIELASLIAATPDDSQPQRWDEHVVDGGRLFFVGDAKQSIYRFRRADIKLFLQARDRFTGGSDPVQLTTNFRTVAPIIDWVNGLFSEVMPEEIPDAQPQYEALGAWRGPGLIDGERADHRPMILGGKHPDPKVKAGELRELEAEEVAALIDMIRGEPEVWPVGLPDDEDGQPQWRPARLSDITILIPTRTSLPYLRSALESQDLPYRLTTGTLVYDTQEVRDALAVLRAIDDPTDMLSLVAALRSPLYGCSDVDLFEFRRAKGQWNLRKQDHGVLDPDHRVIQAMAHLRGLWKERWWNGPVALLGQILEDSEAHLLAFGHERPAEVWRRLRFLLDQARLFEEQVGTSIRGFIDWAGLQSADGSRVHEPLLPETDEDAIQISTVHGAKGLEFPITILSGMTTEIAARARPGVSVLWNDDGQPEVKIRKGLSSAGHGPRADLEQSMDVHEKMRLLYVAATRARDHLVISTHHKAETPNKKTGEMGAPKTYASRIAGYCERNPSLVQSVSFGGPIVQVTCVGYGSEPPSIQEAGGASASRPGLDHEAELTAQAEWQAARDELLEPVRKKRVMSATAMARMVDETALDLDPGDEDDDQADQGVIEVGEGGTPVIRRKGRAGSAIGRAVHNTLEHLDFASPGDVERQVIRQCELELIPELADTVLALVRSALGSESVRLAVEHKAYKEIYVAAPLGDTMVEGYVDLLIETPDGLIIVDYKTDSAKTEAEVAKKLAAYELQGASYAVVLEESTGLKVIDCRFVFCNTGGTIERSVVDLDAAKQRVRDLTSAP